jgi:16S rRNA (uracil1498-N3)-methyltransferase
MQSPDYDFRLPRLYVDAPLSSDAIAPLSPEQTHYLKTVLRRPEDAELRLFNGLDGEWLGRLAFSSKKDSSVSLIRQIREQAFRPLRLHLIFAPIKKDRMDFLVEKAVELGVTDLHPVLTQFTTIRDINPERMTRQIIEAGEQCERLDLPKLHPLRTLKDFIPAWDKTIPVLGGFERIDAPFISTIPNLPQELGLLIGPEGGFGDEERSALLTQSWIKAVSLGDQILRAETAALFGLVALMTRGAS